MEEELKLTDEQKEQLLSRINESLDKDLLNLSDWMAIYDIMLNACVRKEAALSEEYMILRMSDDTGGITQ